MTTLRDLYCLYNLIGCRCCFQADVNGDGELDKEELMKLMAVLGTGMTEKEVTLFELKAIKTAVVLLCEPIFMPMSLKWFTAV